MASPVRLGFSLCLSLLALTSLLIVLPVHATETYFYETQWGGQGNGPTQFWHPEGACVHGSEVFVADRSNHRVRVFTLDGAFLRGYAPGVTFSPSDVAVDSSGNVYVTDANLGQVRKLNNALDSLLGTWGSDGSEDDQLYGPQGICIDELRNRVYVADTNNQRVSVWRMNGTFVTTFGAFGHGDGELSLPTDVALDSRGRIFVVDSANNRVQRFGPNYVYQSQFSGSLATGGLMMTPCGIFIDASDRVYVSNRGSNKVYKYTLIGDLLAWFGSSGAGNGQFDQPRGLAMDGSSRLYVVDSENHRIQRFGHNVSPTRPTSVVITPSLPRDDATLRATATGSTDADGDAIRYQYRWDSSPDGAAWSYQVSGRLVSATLTTVGEYWRVRARAYDGRAYSAWRTSASVRIRPLAVPGLVASAQQTGAGTLAVLVTLRAAATVEGNLRNLAGRPVATMAGRALPEGMSNITIAARSTTGTALPAGQYLLTLRASAPDGARLIAVCPVRVR